MKGWGMLLLGQTPFSRFCYPFLGGQLPDVLLPTTRSPPVEAVNFTGDSAS